MRVKAVQSLVRLGRITGAYGVKGWVRVASDTERPERILDYRPWRILHRGEWVTRTPVGGRRHADSVLAKLEGVDDRDGALALTGADIAVPRAALPETAGRELYWVDLVGAEVVSKAGVSLGRVDHLMATGANDVLVCAGERERLIPFIDGEVVLDVDLAAGRITVDWDPEY